MSLRSGDDLVSPSLSRFPVRWFLFFFILWYPGWTRNTASLYTQYYGCLFVTKKKVSGLTSVWRKRSIVAASTPQRMHHSTTYSSVLTTASDENTTSSPPLTLVTFVTLIPGKLPGATKPTLTGKNTPTSSPSTLNSSVPERSSAEIRGIDQSRACVEGLSVQLEEASETVG